jgi:hypothetical protein
MARENQGLQIALIVFVMLTIVLSVMTFLFFRKYDDQAKEAERVAKMRDEKDKSLKKKEAECEDFRDLVGFPRDEEFSAIGEKSQKDREPFKKLEKDDPEKLPSYRKIFDFLAKQNDEKTAELAAVQDKLRKLEADYKSREAAMKPQIDAAYKARDDMKQQLAADRDNFQKERDRYKKEQNEAADLLEKARKDLAAELSKAQSKLSDTDRQVKKLTEDNQELAKAKNKGQKEAEATFSGQVKWVDQRSKTVWIDLGQADGLNRQTFFSVYAADAIDLTKSGKKASIEVILLQGPHTAEARIVDDKMSDPIIPGDKIYSPVWSPGQRKHFALVGFMDIDSDGKSDLAAVRSLIVLNGGVVDYELNENGDQRGAMTVNTRYLIKGDPPNLADAGSMETKIEEYTKEYSKALKKAESLGIESLPFTELLQRMGWKQPVTLNRSGNGRTAVTAVETEPAKSSEPASTVSDISDEASAESNTARKDQGLDDATGESKSAKSTTKTAKTTTTSTKSDTKSASTTKGKTSTPAKSETKGTGTKAKSKTKSDAATN